MLDPKKLYMTVSSFERAVDPKKGRLKDKISSHN
jgi:hypothetical protein